MIGDNQISTSTGLAGVASFSSSDRERRRHPTRPRLESGRRPDMERIRTRRQRHLTAVAPLHPRQACAVPEPGLQSSLQFDFARQPLHDPDHVASTLGHGHEVDHPNRSVGAGKLGLQDHRVVPVPLRSRVHAPGRPQPPSAVLIPAEHRSEAGFGVEPKNTQPIHVGALGYQSRAAGVANEPVILNERSHNMPPT